jgi:cytoplasmic iron level regulating protein YaaA (DUF328/UPF0246 family)
MLFIISPAKTLDYENADYQNHTMPRMLDRSQELVDILKKKKGEGPVQAYENL